MPLPAPNPQATRVCLSDTAYDSVRGWILDGTLAPGEPIRDEALAQTLGMSRTPVREALRRLEEEGFVATTASRRFYVSEVSLRQARELYPIIAALETLAMRMSLARLDGRTLAAMEAANARLAEALDALDATAATEADAAVHAGLTAQCENDHLTEMITSQRATIWRIERAFWGAADRSPSLRDHADLIAALRKRDADRAERVLARNWKRGLEWLLPEQGK